MAPPLCTKEEAFDAAARVASDAWAALALQTPEQAAEAAYRPGGLSREEIAARIRQYRAEAARTAA
jgi:hypothetical protein